MSNIEDMSPKDVASVQIGTVTLPDSGGGLPASRRTRTLPSGTDIDPMMPFVTAGEGDSTIAVSLDITSFRFETAASVAAHKPPSST